MCGLVFSPKRNHSVPYSTNLVTNSPDTSQPIQSRRSTILFTLAALVSLIGLADAIYLAVEHLSGRSVRCTITSGCSEVLSSEYATVRGIPLAMIGAAAYFTVFSLAVLAAYSYKWAAKLVTVIVAIMFLTTLWLLYLQAFVIKHFCQFCLLSALVTFVLTVLIVISLRRN
jgi:uncharacterized membrane protein